MLNCHYQCLYLLWGLHLLRFGVDSCFSWELVAGNFRCRCLVFLQECLVLGSMYSFSVLVHQCKPGPVWFFFVSVPVWFDTRCIPLKTPCDFVNSWHTFFLSCRCRRTSNVFLPNVHTWVWQSSWRCCGPIPDTVCIARFV